MPKLNSNTLHIAAMAALAITVLSSHALAEGATISGGWFRMLPAGLPAGGYFELHNGGSKTVTLTGAESPVCGTLMLHRSDDTGGMARMMEVARVDVGPGQTLRFAPGGYHLMCMQPKAMLSGTHVPVTLRFADGTRLKSDFVVRNAAGR